MKQFSRRRELARYRQHLREHLAEEVARWEPTMHPDFGLTDQDAADAMSELEKELREPPKPLLMVTASTRPQPGQEAVPAEEPSLCLGMRFCYPDGVAHVESLLITQIRNRYPTYRDMKPREVRRALDFTVWIVPAVPTRGGWPVYDGPTCYWR